MYLEVSLNFPGLHLVQDAFKLCVHLLMKENAERKFAARFASLLSMRGVVACEKTHLFQCISQGVCVVSRV